MKHFDYVAELDGPQSRIAVGRRRILAKGGDSGDNYYKNADELYKQQADTAEFMLGIGKQYLPGATEGYFQASRDYFDPAYAARMAGEAGTTAQKSIDQNKATLTRDMARYGINPASGRWGSMMNSNAMSGAALKAGSINAANRGVEDKRLGVAKDFYSSMVGMPSDSAATAGSAASGYANMGAAADQRAANDQAGMANIAAMGYETFFAADGGEIRVNKGETALHRLSREVWDAGERFYNKGKAKPEHLGSGSAKQAGAQLRGRKSRIDAALAAAEGGDGYADGGFVLPKIGWGGAIAPTEDTAQSDSSYDYGGSFLQRLRDRKKTDNTPTPASPRAQNIWAQGIDRAAYRPTDSSTARMVVDEKQHYNKGGMVKKDGARCMAMGGLFKQPAQPPLAATGAPQQPQQPSMVNRSTIKAAKMMKDGPQGFANKLNMQGGKGMERVGNFFGDQSVAAQGIGKQGAASGTDMSGAINAYKEAGMTDVSGALSKGAGMNPATGLTAASEQTAALAAQNAGLEGAAAATDAALAGGVEAAGAEALAGTAAGVGAEAAGAGLASAAGALGTAAAAIPWLGAAVAAGSILGLFNEGGDVEAGKIVEGRKDYTPGGAVTGPTDGTTTGDKVPAWLTDKEFVVNAEAVAMGNNREKLHKMNAAGLAARRGVRGGR